MADLRSKRSAHAFIGRFGGEPPSEAGITQPPKVPSMMRRRQAVPVQAQILLMGILEHLAETSNGARRAARAVRAQSWGLTSQSPVPPFRYSNLSTGTRGLMYAFVQP